MSSAQFITPQELKKEINQHKPLFILDVRQPDEVATGKIPGATNIPLPELEQRLNELPSKTAPIITVCAHGIRSEKAMLYLKEHGYKNTRTLIGGTEGWKDEKYPIELSRKQNL